MIQWPVAMLTHADQVWLTVVVHLRQRQIRALPERVHMMHNAAPNNCGALATEEFEPLRMQVAIALVVLLPPDFPPELPPGW